MTQVHADFCTYCAGARRYNGRHCRLDESCCVPDAPLVALHVQELRGDPVTNEPWIGDESDRHGLCEYGGLDYGGEKCGSQATLHILTESAMYGLVSLPTCDLHAPIAREAGAYRGEHAYGPTCMYRLKFWRTDGCHLQENA